MKRAMILSIAVLASGCMSYTLVAGDPDVTPDRAHHVTLHSIAWGAAGDRFDATTQEYCAGSGAATVRVQDNFGYTVLNVLTLGFWQPMDVYFTCAVPSGPIGDPLGGS